MNLTFYKNISDPKSAMKNLTSLGEISGVAMRDETQVVNPEFLVASQALPSAFNYCYCDYTGRYYFTGDPVMVRTGLYRIPCHCDILTTAYAQYKDIVATISRNEQLATGYMLDPELKTLSYQNIATLQFPNAMEDDSIVLMTVG